MANCISYSLFGYGQSYESCYGFKSYLRYLSLNLRMNALLYPGWVNHLVLDRQTYESPYREFFDYHAGMGNLAIVVMPKKELCRMMLYRLAPLFMANENGTQLYDRVLCRDLDSLATYRERQAVQYWINNGRAVHVMTDSVSHNITMMGGMCGFQTAEVKKMLRVYSLDDLLQMAPQMDYNIKGADQDFLNRVTVPRVASSMTEHYLMGMPQSFRGDCYNYVQDVPLEIPDALKESNTLVNHIGQAGFIIEPVLQFFKQHMDEDTQRMYSAIEERYEDVFYWIK